MDTEVTTSYRNAIISVYHKDGLDKLVRTLMTNNYCIYSTGGTYEYIKEQLKIIGLKSEERLIKIADLTGFPEILNGRVKTLHPMIYAGLLARQDLPEHQEQLKAHRAPTFDLVVVNLYPFDQVANVEYSLEESQELIDIGGVTLLRAAAKNCQTITVLSHPDQYVDYRHRLIHKSNILEYRLGLARQAFITTSQYDQLIQQRLQQELDEKRIKRQYQIQFPLKYGCNPHQVTATLHTIGSEPHKNPITLLNGNPGYINLLDALNGWQLVSTASHHLNGVPVAASFKHTSPAGVARGDYLIDKSQLKAYSLTEQPQSSVTRAYIRARNSDPMSSFGDFISLSHSCDIQTALMIKPEVSDGIIAPGYDPEALNILRKKKGGNYLILQMDRNYCNQQKVEYREVAGMALSQTINNRVVTANDLNKSLPQKIVEDIILTNITMMYSQSNNVAIAREGQVVAIASGQQSRVDCVKLAGRKYQTWYLRTHPKVKVLQELFRSDPPLKRSEKVNATIRYIEGDFSEYEYENWLKNFGDDKPVMLTSDEKGEFLKKDEKTVMCSDAFFPFRDNIDQASRYGVNYIVHPGGSVADTKIEEACKQYGMTLVTTGVRQFTH